MPDEAAIASGVTNYFALLKQPRRPWLDPDILKQSFLNLSAAAHPDRFSAATQPDRLAAGHRFSELNAAYQCLRAPKDRLRHLLELETRAKPRNLERVPTGAMDLFMEIGHLFKQTDAFAVEKSNAASPVLKAQFFEGGLEWTDKLQTMQARLNARQEELTAELKKMNDSWAAVDNSGESRDTLPLTRLEEIYREFGFLGRWSAQLQERVVLLSL